MGNTFLRLLTWCLAHVMGRSADDAVGDLVEERHMRETRGRTAATWWFWCEAMGLAVGVMATRGRRTFRDVLRPLSFFRVAIFTDARHTWRALWRHPGSSLAVIVTLALGVGLTSTMFALADPYVLRPLPYLNPRQLVVIDVSSDGLTRGAPIPTVAEWRARTDLFQGVAAIGQGGLERLHLRDRTTYFVTQDVSANFFDVLGVPGPATTAWTDAPADRQPVVLMARADDSLPPADREMNALLTTDAGRGFRVVGRMPAFLFPDPASARSVQGLTPFVSGAVLTVGAWDAAGTPGRPATSRFIARLQSGITPAIVADALAVRLPSGARLAVTAEPLAAWMTRPSRPLALGAMLASFFVLVVCAANVSNLLLVRRLSRLPELAVRAALGASPADLRRLGLIELGAIAVLAVAVGLAVASVAVTLIARIMPPAYAALGAPAITWRVVVFAAAAGSSATVAGLIPLVVRRSDAAAPITHTRATDGRRAALVRRLSVTLQSAFTMVLVAGAGLLVDSYVHLVGQPAGFDRDVVAVTTMYPPALQGAAMQDVIDATSDRLARVPGVASVAAADGNVVDGLLSTSIHVKFTIDGREGDAQLRSVTADYFATAGMTLRRGRLLRDADRDALAVVVNETLASAYWPDGSAVGRATSMGTIVGVVEDAYEQVYDRRPAPTVYNLLRGRLIGTTATLGGHLSSGITYLLRPSGTTALNDVAVRRALFDVQPDVVTVETNTLGRKLANTVRDRSFATLMLGLFGVAGGAVTLAGLVGVVSVVVAARTREIAVRMAIGAQRRDVRRLVTGDVLRAATVGGIAGLLVGRWLSTLLTRFAYGVTAGAWTPAIAACGVMLVLMVIAALVPARRAASILPADALRSD
jgi:predicted permease